MSFSTGTTWAKTGETNDLARRPGAHLVDLVLFERCLEHLPVRYVFILMLRREFDLCQRYIAVDGVDDAACRCAGAALLYFGVIELKEVVDPREKLLQTRR